MTDVAIRNRVIELYSNDKFREQTEIAYNNAIQSMSTHTRASFSWARFLLYSAKRRAHSEATRGSKKKKSSAGFDHLFRK